MEAPRRILYPLHGVRWILRCVASLFLLLSFSLYLADGASCVNAINAFNNSGASDGFTEVAAALCWTDPLYGDLRPVLIVMAAIIWNIAEFITLCINRKGIHPGAHIGLDLILSCALFSAAAISFYTIAQVGENAALGKYTAAAVFAVLAALIHFALFVLDAISVHKWPRARFGYGVYNGQSPIHPQASAQPVVNQHPGPAYTSLPPPPPGMAYLVPMTGTAGSHTAGVHTMPLPKNGGNQWVEPDVSAASPRSY